MTTVTWEAHVNGAVVASGGSAVEAKQNAMKAGYPEDAILLVQHASEGLIST